MLWGGLLRLTSVVTYDLGHAVGDVGEDTLSVHKAPGTRCRGWQLTALFSSNPKEASSVM